MSRYEDSISNILNDFIIKYYNQKPYTEELNINTMDRTSREQLNEYLEQNLKLPLHYVLKHHYMDNEIEDFFQECCIAFLDAVKNYDPNKGYQFSTFVYSYFLNTIRKYKNSNTFTLTAGLNFMMKARLLQFHMNENISDEELMKKLSVDEKTLFELKRFLILNKLYSLDNPVDFKDDDLTILNILGQDDENIEKINNNNYSDIYELIFGISSPLKPKEKEILYLRFYKNMTFVDIANEYGFTKQYASCVVKNALEKIKKHHIYKLLKEYYYD